MTTDTEALRAQFEAWATAAYRLSFDDDTPLKLGYIDAAKGESND